jgi:superfamily I DNA/RNA helicase
VWEATHRRHPSLACARTREPWNRRYLLVSALTTRVRQVVPNATLHEEADSERALTLFGPPGTGKTTSMLALVDTHLNAGAVDPDRLMIATFTKNARTEAFERLKRATALGEDDFPWVRTIHSACYRLLGLDREQVIQPKDYRSFGQEYGYEFTLGERTEDDPYGQASMQTFGDWCLAADELRRAKLLTVEQAADQFRQPMQVVGVWSRDAAQRFATELREFKREQRLVDFTDMLEFVLADQLRPPATHYFVDEAQDLTPLQWAVVDLWTTHARRVFTFGDDDQAIFCWSGADPHALINRAGHKLVLSRTYRLPADIHAEAARISDRIEFRVPKVFEPVGPGGSVGTLWDWVQMQIAEEGTYLLLARNRMHLESLRDELRHRGQPFSDRTSNAGIPTSESWCGKALRTALALQRGDLVTSRAELRNLRRQLWPELWPEDSITRSPMLTLRDLVTAGATPRLVQRLHEDPLAALRMSRQDREYLISVIRQHGPRVLERRPRVELSTIHGVKGEEADHVLCCTAMTRQTYDGYLRDPDAEHRTFYVAASRAKQTLTWVRVATNGGSYSV